MKGLILKVLLLLLVLGLIISGAFMFDIGRFNKIIYGVVESCTMRADGYYIVTILYSDEDGYEYRAKCRCYFPREVGALERLYVTSDYRYARTWDRDNAMSVGIQHIDPEFVPANRR